MKHVFQPESQLRILGINVEDASLAHSYCRHGLEMSLPTVDGLMGRDSRLSLDGRKSEAIG